MFQTAAGRTARTRPYSAAAWPLVIERQRLPRLGLSTLNSMAFGLAVYASQRRLRDTTQDSLPVAGQALLDGILTRKVPMKGFKVVDYISFSFPKLSWRNRCNLCLEANVASRSGVDHLSHLEVHDHSRADLRTSTNLAQVGAPSARKQVVDSC